MSDRELRHIDEVEPDHYQRIARWGLPPHPVAVAPALGAALYALPGAQWECPGYHAFVLRWSDNQAEPEQFLTEDVDQAIRAAKELLRSDDPRVLAALRRLEG